MYDILLIVLAVLATAGRVLGLIGLSILSGWFLSYMAIKNRIFENIFISINEVFESVPVIAFFPIVLVIFIAHIGGALGVELASDFLVFTAVVWNLWLGEYQAFKTVPKEMVEIADNYNYSFFERLKAVYIPFSIPRIAANLFPSVSDGFFYITVSEVFTVGVTTYETFGVGYTLDNYVRAGNFFLVSVTLIVMGIVVAGIILALKEITKRAVSKYALDTDVPIMRRGKPRLRQSATLSAITSLNPLGKLATYNRMSRRKSVNYDTLYYAKSKKKNYGLIGAIFGIVILSLLIYAAYEIVTSISIGEWGYLISKTPLLLLNLLYDYIRVAIITLISTAFAIFAGYHIATHKKTEAVAVPLIQGFSAYPVPTYFPFLFFAIYPFTASLFGSFADEFFVLGLGFLGTFYYVFYSFWMGIKAMPSEYNEVMKNLNLGYFKKMRYIILPSTFPYLVTGITSTINSAWGGLMIGEYWPNIAGGRTLTVQYGLMKIIDQSTSNGNIAFAAWGSFLFAIIVAIYSILFTRKMMDLARKKYVAEEGIYAA
ncbi:MAG: ABC transporter permease subunit [Thermoplasmataceae archaeon]